MGAGPDPVHDRHDRHKDRLGSASHQTGSSGTCESHEVRGPFGIPGAGGSASAGSALATDLKYTDQRSFESGVGSYYCCGSRDYSPVLGRFLQPDTMVPGAGNPQDLNRYGYVRNDPLRYVDPVWCVPYGRPSHKLGSNAVRCSGGFRTKPDGPVWWVTEVHQPWSAWARVDEAGGFDTFLLMGNNVGLPDGAEHAPSFLGAPAGPAPPARTVCRSGRAGAGRGLAPR